MDRICMKLHIILKNERKFYYSLFSSFWKGIESSKLIKCIHCGENAGNHEADNFRCLYDTNRKYSIFTEYSFCYKPHL